MVRMILASLVCTDIAFCWCSGVIDGKGRDVWKSDRVDGLIGSMVDYVKDNKLYELIIYIKPDKEFEDEGYFSDEGPILGKSEKRLEDLEGVPTEYYIYPVFRKK